MIEYLYVYGDRAFGPALAAGHHPTLRHRLARRVPYLDREMPSFVFRVRGDGQDELLTDPVAVARLSHQHPGMRVSVMHVQDL